MTKLDPAKTRRAINRRTGRPEIIEAVSADGRWGYTREDDERTTWWIRDLRTNEDVKHQFGTLARARRWTHADDTQTATADLRAS